MHFQWRTEKRYKQQKRGGSGESRNERAQNDTSITHSFLQTIFAQYRGCSAILTDRNLREMRVCVYADAKCVLKKRACVVFCVGLCFLLGATEQISLHLRVFHRRQGQIAGYLRIPKDEEIEAKIAPPCT